jgi:hypothetical protein
MVHCTIADFICDIGVRRDARSRLHFHGGRLSEYCTCLPSTHPEYYRLDKGLYPTLIIILVGMQMSPVEHYSTHSTEMQFTHVTAFGPPGDSIPQHVLMIQREYKSDSDIQDPSIVSMKGSD